MPFDFDKPIDHRNTNSSKWDGMEAYSGVSPDTGIAMWVAEMDFQSPPAVNATLRKLADHGAHGYFGNPAPYYEAITGWMRRRHSWHVRPEWILTTQGLCNALGMVIQTFSAPGDGVIVFAPVYHAFYRLIEANERRVVESRLRLSDRRYEMDLAALEAKLDGSERIMLLCSPHNPGGRVWSVAELRAVAAFCKKHDILLVSDEVHHDLVFPGYHHTVMANAAPDIADRLIMLTAPSKTFNLAGFETGQIIVSDEALRARLRKTLQAANIGVSRIGAMATMAAYAYGEPWLRELITYLDENRRMFDAGIDRIPGLKCMPMQATYLAWVDFSGTGMEPAEFTRRVEQDAKITASHGSAFGTGGESFLRFNIATRRALIGDALERLEHAFADLQ
ncbi:MalY/PatB family protein [Oceanibium sediminis]|uniref:MalY/PatB family protein n=1 Tax=Oceanibium sediminis TaxID=2026339 RepID=UPI000DD3216F|nr:MalY/PatB family protein [Oceanibium sediminis]